MDMEDRAGSHVVTKLLMEENLKVWGEMRHE